MRVRSLLILAVFVSAGSAMGVDHANAAECGGSIGRDARRVECVRESGPLPGIETGGSSGSRLPEGWTVDVIYGIADPGLGGAAAPVGCDPATGDVILQGDPADWPGVRGFVVVRDGAGTTQALEVQCFGDTPAVPAWLPPTRAEIERALAEAPWPASTTGVDPAVEGLTGLETRLWSTTLAAQPISVTIGNSTIVGTATPVVYRWQMGDGTDASATQPGAHGAPAATHVYQTKGDYEIVLEIVWQADVEVITQLPGGGVLRFPQDPPLAPITIAGSRDYPVVEIRSILIPNET